MAAVAEENFVAAWLVHSYGDDSTISTNPADPADSCRDREPIAELSTETRSIRPLVLNWRSTVPEKVSGFGLVSTKKSKIGVVSTTTISPSVVLKRSISVRVVYGQS
jgi:hypothetical protein